MSFIDYCTRFNSISQDIIDLSKELGWSSLVLSTNEKTKNMENLCCIEIHPKKPSDIQNTANRIRDKNILLSVKTDNLDCARKTLETPEIDILIYNGLINHVMAKIGNKNNVALNFDFSRLLDVSDRSRALVLSELVSNARLVRKFKMPFVLTSGAKDKWSLRSPRDFISWGKTMGFDEKTCKKMLSDHIIVENKKRLGKNWISPGVEIKQT